MPQTAEENTESIPSSGPSATLTTWWKKFHFSGRVIMCSVLFGLGLVLIGGLIFAINTNDNDSKPNKDDQSDLLPTKPPSNYVGPVVMGIGSFIVVVGVIMCLFETQVCRKKTGDASPLISGGNDDPEAKSSDPTAIPSTSHSHKNQSHKCRSGHKSKKSKDRHAKVNSREKISSSQSPPVSIDKPKSFITSSEEKFLTPPNTLEHRNSQDAEIQTSSSLMKSFTSSGPSWSQSAEFLTPSTSFKDNSISLENSVEINGKLDQVNFTTNELTGKEYVNPAFMSPLTIEEDRIQKLLNRVKNEQMEKQEKDEKQSAADINFAFKSENADSSQDELKDSKVDTEMGKNDENIIPLSNDLITPILTDTPSLKEVCNQNAEFQNEELIEKENGGNEEQLHSINHSKADVKADDSFTKAEEINGQSNMNIQADQKESSIADCNKDKSLSANDSVMSPLTEVKDNKEKSLSANDSVMSPLTEVKDNKEKSLSANDSVMSSLTEVKDNKEKSLSANDSVMSPLTEVKEGSSLNPECEVLSNKIIENDKNADLESSTSSDETVVSHDFASSEKPTNLESNNTESSVKEYPCNESKVHPDSEPSKDNENCSSTSNYNSLTDEVEEESTTKDLVHLENNKKDEKSTESSS